MLFRYRLVWEREGKSNKDAKRNLALYDYQSDRGETQNVIDKHPELAKRLQEAFEPWWEEAKQGMINDLHQLKTGNLIGPKMKKKSVKATKKAKREAVR